MKVLFSEHIKHGAIYFMLLSLTIHVRIEWVKVKYDKLDLSDAILQPSPSTVCQQSFHFIPRTSVCYSVAVRRQTAFQHLCRNNCYLMLISSLVSSACHQWSIFHKIYYPVRSITQSLGYLSILSLLLHFLTQNRPCEAPHDKPEWNHEMSPLGRKRSLSQINCKLHILYANCGLPFKIRIELAEN